MVQNLDILAFAPYGKLFRSERQNIDDPVKQELEISAPELRGFLATAPVVVDFMSGMTILAVRTGTEPLRFFYLDKPVQIHPGVEFALLPWQEHCAATITAPGSAQPQPIQFDTSVRELVMSRRIQVERVYTFFYHDKEPGFFFRGEEHSMLELTYVDKGSLHSVAGGQDLVLEQGDMTIYGPNQWHMQYADPGCATSYITITFDLEGESLQKLINRKYRTPQNAVQLLKTMLRERDNEDGYTGDMLICLLGQMLLTVLREGTDGDAPPLRTDNSINNENEMVSRAQRFVADNVRQKLSVPAVAREVGVSPSYLTALFHKNLQISPGEYIRRAKLQESKLMIREGKQNFTEIARILQYSTVHHFSRQFKEKFGITPTEYARSIR